MGRSSVTKPLAPPLHHTTVLGTTAVLGELRGDPCPHTCQDVIKLASRYAVLGLIATSQHAPHLPRAELTQQGHTAKAPHRRQNQALGWEQDSGDPISGVADRRKQS